MNDFQLAQEWAEQDYIESMQELAAEEKQAQAAASEDHAPTIAELEQCSNDNDRAELFAKMFRGLVVYDFSLSAWCFHNGIRWSEDKEGRVYRYVTGRMAAEFLGAASHLRRTQEPSKELDTRVDSLIEEAHSLRTLKHIKSTLELASKQVGMTVPGDSWDQNPWLLAVKNGTLDLRTGELRSASPLDYLKSQSPTNYDANATCPRFERFVSEIFDGDSEMIAFMQRLLGYTLTGMVKDHVLPVLYGSGRNGKSVLLETIGYVMGRELATTIQADALMDSSKNGSAAQPYIYMLRGKRFVWASESNDGRKLNAGLVKQLSGGDTITTRALYAAPVTFNPTHKVFLITNHKPECDVEDEALWDRLLLIPFGMRFVDNPQHAAERKADKSLGDTLKAEASGILNWLIAGCLCWQREGLNVPAAIRAEVDEWRNKADPVAEFVKVFCVEDRTATTSGKALYDAYELWHKAKNAGKPFADNDKLSTTAFGLEMGKKFIKKRTAIGVSYQGVRLVE